MILEELCPVERISPCPGLADLTIRPDQITFLNYYGKPNDFFGVFFVFLIKQPNKQKETIFLLCALKNMVSLFFFDQTIRLFDQQI